MFEMLLADVRIRVENREPYVERLCNAYLVLPDGAHNAAFCVTVTEDEIAEEKKIAPAGSSDGYCESTVVYRRICERLPEFGVFLLHSSVVSVGDDAYAFTADSGVGKTTHCRLWLENIPGAKILNGDKPLYRPTADGSVRVYGTPWNGKENFGENRSATLRGVCFLERGTENAIRHASADEVVTRLLHQLYLRGERGSVESQLTLADTLVRTVPFYVLACTISPEAAKLAYGTMKPD